VDRRNFIIGAASVVIVAVTGAPMVAASESPVTAPAVIAQVRDIYWYAFSRVIDAKNGHIEMCCGLGTAVQKVEMSAELGEAWKEVAMDYTSLPDWFGTGWLGTGDPKVAPYSVRWHEAEL
jgi:hypothetical protein